MIVKTKGRIPRKKKKAFKKIMKNITISGLIIFYGDKETIEVQINSEGGQL